MAVGEGPPRLIYTTGPAYPASFNNLRIFTGAHVIAAMADPHVAGAIAQTNMLDYRDKVEAHFGPPLSCVEVKLREVPGQLAIGDEDEEGEVVEPQGRIVISGPAVVGGGERVLETIGKITGDGTVAFGEMWPDGKGVEFSVAQLSELASAQATS